MQVNLGQKCKKLPSTIQGINAQLSTRVKWPTRQPHMRWNATHKQGDTSSIRGNTVSMNQTRSRGSTGPPELPNRLKKALTPIHEMNAHLAVSRPRFGPNGHTLWLADQHGRPTIGRFIRCPSSTCHLVIGCWSRFQEPPGWIHGRMKVYHPYIYEMRGGGGGIETHNTTQHNLTHSLFTHF